MRNLSPDITVLMSIYNEDMLWLRDSIESILNQTYQNFEFIIINDNPSNDINKVILKEYIKKDNRIKIIENDTNLGLTLSLNKGLRESTGLYIARMDADDIAHKD